MADPSSNPQINKSLTVNLQDLQALGPDALAELQKQHGLEIQLRSSAAGIDKIASNLATNAAKMAQAAFDRGFDRTTPGYDKYYDRDRAMMNPADLVTNPADAVKTTTQPSTPGVDVQAVVDELIRRAAGNK